MLLTKIYLYFPSLAYNWLLNEIWQFFYKLNLLGLHEFSWCSGYHICLTHRRSPVRSRAKIYLLNFDIPFCFIVFRNSAKKAMARQHLDYFSLIVCHFMSSFKSWNFCSLYKIRQPRRWSLVLTRKCVSMGAAGARTRRSLGHHLLHPLILRLLVLCVPAVLWPRALQDAPAPADLKS